MLNIIKLSSVAEKQSKPSIYPRKCESCNIVFPYKQAYFRHIKRCLKESSPENYPKVCDVCNVEFLSHKTFAPHKIYCCKSIRKDKAIDSPYKNSHKKDNRATKIDHKIEVINCSISKEINNDAIKVTDCDTTEETETCAVEVVDSLSCLSTQKSSTNNEGCETCHYMANDELGRMPSYYYHKSICLATKSSMKNTGNSSKEKEETDSGAIGMEVGSFCLFTEKSDVKRKRCETNHSATKDKFCSLPPCYHKKICLTANTDNSLEEKEVSKELKIISDQCQNISEECEKSKENSEIMLALLKKNNALHKSLADSINLILQIKAMKNNVQIVSNNK